MCAAAAPKAEKAYKGQIPGATVVLQPPRQAAAMRVLLLSVPLTKMHPVVLLLGARSSEMHSCLKRSSRAP